MKEVKHYINGQYVGSASGRMFDNINPATGEVISQVHEAGEAEVDAAVQAAPRRVQGRHLPMPVRPGFLRPAATPVRRVPSHG